MSAIEVRKTRLLVVDDEPTIQQLLSVSLRFIGYEVRTAATGADAIALAGRYRPDLVVLDVMLPDIDGLEVIRRLRERDPSVPVLLLTAKDSTEEKVAGLTVGGDDYVTKPFSLEEVIARIKAVIRRTRTGPDPDADDGVLRYADLQLDEETYQVRRGDRFLSLSPTEYKLLRYLLTHAEKVVSKAQILDHVWRYDFKGDARIVESYIRFLRRKVDQPGPPLIHTHRGFGYSLRLPRPPPSEPREPPA